MNALFQQKQSAHGVALRERSAHNISLMTTLVTCDPYITHTRTDTPNRCQFLRMYRTKTRSAPGIPLYVARLYCTIDNDWTRNRNHRYPKHIIIPSTSLSHDKEIHTSNHRSKGSFCLRSPFDAKPSNLHNKNNSPLMASRFMWRVVDCSCSTSKKECAMHPTQSNNTVYVPDRKRKWLSSLSLPIHKEWLRSHPTQIHSCQDN